MRLIIHFNEGQNKQIALLRISNALSEYYRLRPPEDDRRLTVQFDENGAIVIYHSRKDVVLFS